MLRLMIKPGIRAEFIHIFTSLQRAVVLARCVFEPINGQQHCFRLS